MSAWLRTAMTAAGEVDPHELRHPSVLRLPADRAGGTTCSGRRTGKYRLLFAASWVFYLTWNPWSTCGSSCSRRSWITSAGLMIEAAPTAGRRRAWLHRQPRREPRPARRLQVHRFVVENACGAGRLDGPAVGRAHPPAARGSASTPSRASATRWTCTAGRSGPCAASSISPCSSPSSRSWWPGRSSGRSSSCRRWRRRRA